MRTTVTIDDHLLAEAKAVAARSGRTLSDVVEDALRVAFARQDAARRQPVELPTLAGGKLMPGIDLDKTSELLGRMDEEHWRWVEEQERQRIAEEGQKPDPH